MRSFITCTSSRTMVSVFLLFLISILAWLVAYMSRWNKTRARANIAKADLPEVFRNLPLRQIPLGLVFVISRKAKSLSDLICRWLFKRVFDKIVYCDWVLLSDELWNKLFEHYSSGNALLRRFMPNQGIARKYIKENQSS